MNGENCRSLAIDKSPLKSELEDEEALLDKGLASSREKYETLYESNAKPNRRSEFPLDQRGSVNTDIRQYRLRSNLLTHRGSMSVRSSLSRGRSEFSFHPTINYGSKWKPKYDDHHNHKKMWKRMHKENDKIKAKRRLASEKKKLEEMAPCTFKPDLVAMKKKNNFHRQSLKTDDVQRQETDGPMDVRQLSLRLYEYADKFKENKEKKKLQIDNERGNEIRFTPKLETEKFNSQLEVVKEKRNVYSDLYEDSQRRENTYKVIRSALKTKKASISSNDDLQLPLSKPSIGGKHKKYGASQKLEHVKFSNTPQTERKTFSSSIYTASKKPK